MTEQPLWQRQRDALTAAQRGLDALKWNERGQWSWPSAPPVPDMDTRLADLQWAPRAQPPEPPIAWSDTPRPDALTGLLRNAVAAQAGQCLTCNAAPAIYCGLYCAHHPDPAFVLTLHVCSGCGDSGVLYCSAACAARGR